MIEFKVKLFGAFRKYDTGESSIVVCVEEPVTVERIKFAISEKLRSQVSDFSDAQLVEDSAIANDSRVLTSDEMLKMSCPLSILPPVCGG